MTLVTVATVWLSLSVLFVIGWARFHNRVKRNWPQA